MSVLVLMVAEVTTNVYVIIVNVGEEVIGNVVFISIVSLVESGKFL